MPSTHAQELVSHVAVASHKHCKVLGFLWEPAAQSSAQTGVPAKSSQIAVVYKSQVFGTDGLQPPLYEFWK